MSVGIKGHMQHIHLQCCHTARVAYFCCFPINQLWLMQSLNTYNGLRKAQGLC